MRHLPLLAAAVLSTAAAACADDGMSPPDDGTYNCAADTRGDTFIVNLEKQGKGGALDFKLVSADPAPPMRNDNTWVVQINAMAAGVVGGPMAGGTLTVTPFMPDHQHGTPIEVMVTEMPTAGQYQLSPVNMWMPGLWETTITATAGTTTDSAVYRFCIPN